MDVHNGLLLSALWDAAFDAGLISFADDGSVLRSPSLAAEAEVEKLLARRFDGLDLLVIWAHMV